MRTKYLFFSFLFVFNMHLKAQSSDINKVYGLELDTLKTMVLKHKNYFTHLKQKWLNTPQKITSDELMLLYYGSCFMPDYKPVNEDKAINQIAQLMDEMNFEKALIEGKKLINMYPFNARLYMLMGYASKKTGQTKQAKIYYKRYADLIRVPLYSGNGKNFQKAFVVRSISDEYLILNQKDSELIEQAVRYYHKKPFDVFVVRKKTPDNQSIQKSLKQKLYMNIYLPFFVGQNKNYKMAQEEAKKKYKVKP